MKYRNFGSNLKKVSEIGFGAWGLGGDKSIGYGAVKDKIAIESLRKAYENGINFYDTSDIYGNGHSELIISKAFKKDRLKILIASKGGTLPHNNLYMPQNFSSSHLNNALDKSLKRLKTDYIDLYQLHSPKLEDIEKNNSIQTLKDMKKKGKILEYGVSVRSPMDAIKLINRYNIKYIQTNFNLIDQRAQEFGLFKLAKKKKINLIIRTPLVFGFLADTKIDLQKLEKSDHRKNYPKKQLNLWKNSIQKFNFLFKKMTPSQSALRFCLDFNEISTVIPGMLNVPQVIENVKAVNFKSFSKSEYKQIKQIYSLNSFIDNSIKGKKDVKINDIQQA